MIQKATSKKFLESSLHSFNYSKIVQNFILLEIIFKKSVVIILKIDLGNFFKTAQFASEICFKNFTSSQKNLNFYQLWIH